MLHPSSTKRVLTLSTRSGRERTVVVHQHLLDTKLPSVVSPLGKTKLYRAVMTILSKYGALEAEPYYIYIYISFLIPGIFSIAN